MTATFSDVLTAVYKEADKGFEGRVSEVRQRINDAIKLANKSLFKTLVNRGIGKSRTPFFVKTPWSDLEDRYREWKITQGQASKSNPRFFYGTGELAQDLLNLSGQEADVFGEPTIVRQKPGFVKVRGRLKIQPESYTIYPFKKIRGKSDRYLVTNLLDRYAPNTGKKLTAWRGDHRRPLIGPFLRWWIDSKLRTAIDRAI